MELELNRCLVELLLDRKYFRSLYMILELIRMSYLVLVLACVRFNFANQDGRDVAAALLPETECFALDAIRDDSKRK
jgi:hypothetical protein